MFSFFKLINLSTPVCPVNIFQVSDYPPECGLPIRSHTCIFNFFYPLPPRATPLKKTDCAFPRSYQLFMAPQMGHPWAPFSLHAGILTGLILGSAYAGNRSCCVSISAAALPCSGDSVPLQFSQSLALIIVFLPLLQWSPRDDLDVPSVAENLTVTYSLYTLTRSESLC